jgi:hypothetical protein
LEHQSTHNSAIPLKVDDAIPKKLALNSGRDLFASVYSYIDKRPKVARVFFFARQLALMPLNYRGVGF